MLKRKYKRKFQDYERIKGNAKHLIKETKKRRKRFNGLRSHVSKMSSIKFLHVQEMNNQAGHLTLDHKSKTLVPVVKLRKGESEVKDATGMSGGERSYTTLALLMSLTNSIDSPFTCMDEFDVFMDEKNRRTSVKVMLKVAKELKKRQFLFITPNSIPIDSDDLIINGGPVEIQKLIKPKRMD